MFPLHRAVVALLDDADGEAALVAWHERAIARFGPAFQDWRLNSPGELAWVLAHSNPQPGEYLAHLKETCPPAVLASLEAHVRAYHDAGGT
jgi:hypothetical protein